MNCFLTLSKNCKLIMKTHFCMYMVIFPISKLKNKIIYYDKTL